MSLPVDFCTNLQYLAVLVVRNLISIYMYLNSVLLTVGALVHPEVRSD